MVWVGTAVDTVAGRAHYFPDGHIYTGHPTTNHICYEIIVAETAAFIILFVFIYYDTPVCGHPSYPWKGNLDVSRRCIPGGQAPYPTYVGYPQSSPLQLQRLSRSVPESTVLQLPFRFA